jgi:hypothetical protein
VHHLPQAVLQPSPKGGVYLRVGWGLRNHGVLPTPRPPALVPQQSHVVECGLRRLPHNHLHHQYQSFRKPSRLCPLACSSASKRQCMLWAVSQLRSGQSLS